MKFHYVITEIEYEIIENTIVIPNFISPCLKNSRGKKIHLKSFISTCVLATHTLK